jgi:tellurite resistance protein
MAVTNIRHVTLAWLLPPLRRADRVAHPVAYVTISGEQHVDVFGTRAEAHRFVRRVGAQRRDAAAVVRAAQSRCGQRAA